MQKYRDYATGSKRFIEKFTQGLKIFQNITKNSEEGNNVLKYIEYKKELLCLKKKATNYLFSNSLQNYVKVPMYSVKNH